MTSAEENLNAFVVRQQHETQMLNEILEGRAGHHYMQIEWLATMRGYLAQAHANELRLARQCIEIEKRQEQAA